jgi:hypothetical protein
MRHILSRAGIFEAREDGVHHLLQRREDPGRKIRGCRGGTLVDSNTTPLLNYSSPLAVFSKIG